MEHLGSLAEFAREDEEFLELLAREHCEALARRTKIDGRISVRDFLQPIKGQRLYTEGAESTEDTEKKNQAALTKRMLRRLIEERKSGTGQITGQHIAAVLDLARHGENGKSVQLPGGVDVRREQNELVFCTNSSRPALRTSGKRGEGKIFCGGVRVQNRFYEYQKWRRDFASAASAVRFPPQGD